MDQPQNTTVADATQVTPPASETPATWDAFLEKQPEEVKALYASHSEKLLNAVKDTRDERDAFKKQLKDLAKLQEAGSEAQKQLEAMTAQLELAERRASFLEEAVNPAIDCRNPRAAWAIAEHDNLFDKKGLPDWAAIRAATPESFGKPIANANAGAGTGNPPAPRQDMNSFIRSRGGRG